jgi:pyruvate dehydrogenase E1 component
MSSFIAAGTSYAHRGVPMVPFHIFYSMFGFQRVGDLIWLAADAEGPRVPARATAGRTTLSASGLQHQDGQEPPACIPRCRPARPTTRVAYEMATIEARLAADVRATARDVFLLPDARNNENY